MAIRTAAPPSAPRSPSPGAVDYRVLRVLPDGRRSAVGWTSATSLEDGGVRDGDIVRVDVGADGSGLVLTSAGAAPEERTDASASDPADDVVEAEQLDD